MLYLYFAFYISYHVIYNSYSVFCMSYFISYDAFADNQQCVDLVDGKPNGECGRIDPLKSTIRCLILWSLPVIFPYEVGFLEYRCPIAFAL